MVTVRAASFRQLFDEHFAFVWSSLRRLGVPAADREDLTHDVFLHVFRRLPDFDESRPLRPWLFGFAYRIASDHRRRARHRYEVLTDTSELAAPATAHDEDTIARKEEHTLLQEALEHVDIERRAVLLLHDIEQTPIPDIARVLGIPLNTAYSRLRVARAELATAVKRIRAREKGPR